MPGGNRKTFFSPFVVMRADHAAVCISRGHHGSARAGTTIVKVARCLNNRSSTGATSAKGG